MLPRMCLDTGARPVLATSRARFPDLAPPAGHGRIPLYWTVAVVIRAALRPAHMRSSSSSSFAAASARSRAELARRAGSPGRVPAARPARLVFLPLFLRHRPLGRLALSPFVPRLGNFGYRAPRTVPERALHTFLQSHLAAACRASRSAPLVLADVWARDRSGPLIKALGAIASWAVQIARSAAGAAVRAWSRQMQAPRCRFRHNRPSALAWPRQLMVSCSSQARRTAPRLGNVVRTALCRDATALPLTFTDGRMTLPRTFAHVLLRHPVVDDSAAPLHNSTGSRPDGGASPRLFRGTSVARYCRRPVAPDARKAARHGACGGLARDATA